jgi:hypothetical protein
LTNSYDFGKILPYGQYPGITAYYASSREALSEDKTLQFALSRILKHGKNDRC